MRMRKADMPFVCPKCNQDTLFMYHYFGKENYSITPKSIAQVDYLKCVKCGLKIERKVW